MLGDVESIPHFLEKLKRESNEVLRIAYVSALGTLRSTEAIGELFALLHQTQAEVLRGEIGLALARIAGDERYYIQNWHSLRSNPNTATAQAVLALQKLAKQPGAETFAALAETCGQCFAQDDSLQATAILKDMLRQLPTDNLDKTLVSILNECAKSLAEFGDTRLEFILLSLHTLDLALRQNGN